MTVYVEIGHLSTKTNYVIRVHKVLPSYTSEFVFFMSNNAMKSTRVSCYGALKVPMSIAIVRDTSGYKISA